MKKLAIILGLFLGTFGIASAFVSSYPSSYTSWTVGNTITSAWLNTVEQMIGTGSTSTSLTQQIANVSSSVLASSTWLKTANNLSDLSSTSSARTNIGFTAGTGISLSASGAFSNTGVLSVASSVGNGGISMSASTGSGITASIASLNISQFTNDSSYASTGYVGSTALLKASNLSDLTNTSTARSNIGYSQGTGITISGAGVIAATGLLAASTTPTANYSPIANASGTLATGWVGQSANDSYNFLGSTTFANTTLGGTTTIPSNLTITASSSFINNASTTFIGTTTFLGTTIGLGRNILLGTLSGNYSTTSGSFVDVDSINLKKTITIAQSQPILINYAAKVGCAGSGGWTGTWQILDTVSNMVVASGTTIAGSPTDIISGTNLFISSSTSATISMQMKASNCTFSVLNTGTGQYSRPSILLTY